MNPSSIVDRSDRLTTPPQENHTHRLIWRYFCGVRELEEAKTQTFIFLVLWGDGMGSASASSSEGAKQGMRGEASCVYWMVRGIERGVE